MLTPDPSQVPLTVWVAQAPSDAGVTAALMMVAFVLVVGMGVLTLAAFMSAGATMWRR